VQQESIVWFALRDVANPTSLGFSCKAPLRTDVGGPQINPSTTPRMNDRLWPVREPSSLFSASAAPETTTDPEIRCALVRAQIIRKEINDAAMPSNHQSKRIRVGHKPRNADEHQYASFMPLSYSLCSEGPSELSWTTLHFPPLLAWLRTKVL